MSSLNKVILIGRLGADPDCRQTPAGADVCNFSLATSKRWTDGRTGKKREETTWHRIVVWGKLALLCAEHLRKGSLIYLEGEIQNRKFTDKEGQERFISEVQAFVVEFLDRTGSASAARGAEEESGSTGMFGSGGAEVEDDVDQQAMSGRFGGYGG